jgi:hypothetical protein
VATIGVLMVKDRLYRFRGFRDEAIL